MGQFKPMVKMYTTEPTVELKLKKGGKVKKMQMGGPSGVVPMPSLPARGGMAPAQRPAKPSLAARRRAMRAMPAAAAPAAPVGMAGQMMKKGGETKAQHKAEMAKMSKTAAALKEHASKPASKAHKGLKTGGVAMNRPAGFKSGGVISEKASAKGAEGYKNTKMHSASKEDHSPAKTGEVKMGKPGGYATGGVAKSNAGGYKRGGAAKKRFAAGGVVDSGAPVAMPQGRKKPSAPVSITALSGTFKKGGKVTPAQGRLQATFKKENAPAMKAAKAYSNETYSKYGLKMKGGGNASEAERRFMKSLKKNDETVPVTDVEAELQTLRNQRGYQNYKNIEKEENEAVRKFFTDIPGKVVKGVKGLFEPRQGSVTETERSVTVTPAKKRGGRVC